MGITLIGSKIQPHTPLWRYMKVSTFLLLLEGKAFFPSVNTLQKEDPMEGSLFCDEAWLNGMLYDLKGETEFNNLDSWLKGEFHGWENEIAPFSYRYTKSIQKRRAVWCWFKSDLESAAMWSIYGHQGIAIQTTYSEFIKAMPECNDFEVGEMYYVTRQPASLNSYHPESKNGNARLQRPHFVKAKEYEHEHEIRIVTDCHPDEPGVLVEGIDSKNLISKIVISPLIPYDEAIAIESLIENLFPQKRPSIERSQLLGSKADLDETRAVMGKKFKEASGLSKETDLPFLMQISPVLEDSQPSDKPVQ